MIGTFKGYTQIYTGEGKGKTTAALGLALRASGHGLKVYFGQFLKGRRTGEIAAAERLSPYLTIVQFGRAGFVKTTRGPDKEDQRLARDGLGACQAAMLSGAYSIIILDEILIAVQLGLISETEVLDFLGRKPEGVEVVLTGRGATPGLIAKADLVTEMKDVKHYSAGGVRARDGIER